MHLHFYHYHRTLDLEGIWGPLSSSRIHIMDPRSTAMPLLLELSQRKELSPPSRWVIDLTLELLYQEIPSTHQYSVKTHLRVT